MTQERHAVQGVATEFAFTSGKACRDAFNDVELDVAFTGPDGRTWRVPAFWSGGLEWRVRFAPPLPGLYRYTTISTAAGGDLHGRDGVLRATPFEGGNVLLRRGPLRVGKDRHRLEHADGTPFFWLGDTWWMGLCKRLRWPDEFQLLAADRAAKGFTVVQIVAGLYPDMPPFDPRGANEASFPWEKDYARINPGYFDMADLRIQWLVRSGLVPCIVGCWGYFLPMIGVEKMKKHWRNIVARWGALPVVWCLAGEGTMPWYLSDTKEQDSATQKAGWTEIARYVRSIDPFRHPVTIHPSSTARDTVADDSLLDFDMLQTGHSGFDSVPNTQQVLRAELARTPRMPVLVGEVCYEGILEGSRSEVQRFMFWSSMLTGAAGHTYGANGIWQLYRPEQPFGPSPWGASWGDTAWQDAMNLPGGAQMALGKRLLEGFGWTRLEPHQEWVEPAAGADGFLAPYAAGVPGEIRVIYLPRPLFPWDKPTKVKSLEDGVAWRASFINPKDGREVPLGRATPSAGEWQVPLPPVAHDWLLVLEKADRTPTPPGATMYA